jgi:Arc/MetJ family transcription regulator
VHIEVYACSVGRTNIDIDDELIARVMRIYRLPTKRKAVDYALRRLAVEPMSEPARLCCTSIATSMRSPSVCRW